MTNTIQIFENEEFDAIRTMIDEQGETWFCGQGGRVGRGDHGQGAKVTLNLLERRDEELALFRPRLSMLAWG